MSESSWPPFPPNGITWTTRNNDNNLFSRERRELEELGLDFNYDDDDDADFNSSLPVRSHSSMGAATSSLSRVTDSLQQVSPSHLQSQYSIGSESPDPYQQFLEPSPVPSPQRSNNTSRTARSLNIVDLTDSSDLRADNMPSITRSSTLKKRRASTPEDERQMKIPRTSMSATPGRAMKRDSSTEIVDLVDIDGDEAYNEFKAKKQAEALKQQQQEEADKPVKLAEFQCIICMDNPTDLTVTHCGHLFCSECLHQALHAGQGKKSCPVCRQTIVVPVAGRKPPKKNGYFLLEMKLMTANKLGKQPAKGT